MKKALAVAFLCAIFAGFVAAQTIELDLDGTPGNGPDVVPAAVSDYINVDVYINGTGMLFSANFTICNLDGSLEFQGYAYNTPWTNTPPVVTPPCVLIQATDFTFGSPLAMPFLHGTATYHAAVDASLDDLTIDLANSGWFNDQFLSGAFSDFVGGSVQIGSSATEQTNWGAVKDLFR